MSTGAGPHYVTAQTLRQSLPAKPSPTSVEEKYYVIFFSSEGTPNIARLSHGFATCARTRTKPGEESFDDFTISWMPANLEVRFRLWPESGTNLDLPASFDYVQSVDGRVFAWGPYEIDKQIYDRALEQFERLQQGRLLYRMADLRLRHRPHLANNCYHSITDIAPKELIMTGAKSGEEMGPIMVEHFRPWLINPQETHDWIVDMLGLRQFQVTFRRMEFDPNPATINAN